MLFSGNRFKLKHCAATLLIALLTTATAFADTSKISPDLQPLLNGHTRVNVIVQYNAPPATGGLLGLVGGLLGGVINLLGGVVNTVFSLIPALSATIDSGNLLALSNQPN